MKDSIYRSVFFVFYAAVFILIFRPIGAGSNEILNVGLSIYSPPIYFEDEDHFKIRGVSAEIARMLSDNMHAEIVFHAIDDIGLAESIENGFVDFIICVKDDIKDSQNLNFIETTIRIDRTFFAYKNCTLFKTFDNLPGHTVITQGSNNISRLLTVQSDASYIGDTDIEESLMLTDSGEAQIFISHSSLLDINTIRQRGFKNIIEVGTPVINSPLVIATHKNNSNLHAELWISYKKCFNTNRYNSIVNSWVNRDFRLAETRNRNIGYFFATYSKYVLIIAGLITTTLLTSVLWSTTLKRKVQKVTHELNRSEKKYKGLIESSPDMIYLVTDSGEIRLANKIASDIFGYDEITIKSLRLHDFVLEEQNGSLNCFLDDVFQKKFSRGEFTFKTKSEHKIQVEMVSTIVDETEGEELLACCFSRDLTERKQLEEKLIHTDRLTIMGQMTAGIAHEINNPLGIISTNAEELINYELERDESLEILKTIQRNAMRAGKIIEDLLSFTCPSPLNKTKVDFIQLIDESFSFLKPKMKKKNITFRKEFSTAALPLIADEKMMQQLIMNLMLNAVQAVDQAGIITIKTKTRENHQIVFDVIDNGIGIPSDNLEKIFNPFFTHRKEGGFGLGLFVTKIIIEKHNGHIAVSSKENEGAHFTVELPLS